MRGNSSGSGSGEWVETGVPGLDRLLGGGLKRGAVHMLIGEPGAGKTVLAHQIASHRIREGDTVLYMTLVVEAQDALVGQARGFSFFDASQVGRKLYYASALGAVQRTGAEGLWREIVGLVEDRAPSMLVLDGAHTLRLMDMSTGAYYRFFSDLGVQASLTGMVVLVLFAHVTHTDGLTELAIPDGVLRFRTETAGLHEVRRYSVDKLRGAAHITGWHTATLDSDGVRIYPRLETRLEPDAEAGPGPEPYPMRFGVRGLDEMLGGGVPSGSATLVAGSPGSGKTLLGLAFLTEGADRGEPGLYYGFHEPPDRLIAKAEGVGIRLRAPVERGMVRLVRRAPVEMLPDVVADALLAMADESGARRVVLDGVDALQHSFIHKERVVPFLTALTDLLRARGIGCILAQEVQRVLTGEFALPIEEVSGIVDNVLIVRYLEARSRLRRKLSILKMREQEYDTSTREFRITAGGIEVGRVYEESIDAFTGRDRPGMEEAA